jgi:hypothetical protein
LSALIVFIFSHVVGFSSLRKMRHETFSILGECRVLNTAGPVGSFKDKTLKVVFLP